MRVSAIGLDNPGRALCKPKENTTGKTGKTEARGLMPGGFFSPSERAPGKGKTKRPHHASLKNRLARRTSPKKRRREKWSCQERETSTKGRGASTSTRPRQHIRQHIRSRRSRWTCTQCVSHFVPQFKLFDASGRFSRKESLWTNNYCIASLLLQN